MPRRRRNNEGGNGDRPKLATEHSGDIPDIGRTGRLSGGHTSLVSSLDPGNGRNSLRNVTSLERELWDVMTRQEKIQWLSQEKEREFQIRMAEISYRGQGTTEQQRLSELDKYAKSVKASIRPMPQEPMALPSWFAIVERIFRISEVPEMFWGRLLIQFLTEQAHSILANLQDGDIERYELVKTAILAQYRLAPAEYWKKFRATRKTEKETWTQFVIRLNELLKLYWKSKEVDSVEKALELVVADQFKLTLEDGVREYVVLQEGKAKQSATVLAELVEKYYEAHPNAEKSKKKDVDRDCSSPKLDRYQGLELQRRPSGRRGSPDSRRKRLCFSCGLQGHVRRNCPLNREEHEDRNVQKVSIAELQEREVESQESGSTSYEETRVAKVDIGMSVPVRYSSRQTATVEIEAHERIFLAVVDSGTEMTVLHSSILEGLEVAVERKTKLISAFGEEVVADVASVPMKLQGWPEGAALYVRCTLTPKLSPKYACLINTEDLRDLQDMGASLERCGRKSIQGNLGKEEECSCPPEPKVDQMINQESWMVGEACVADQFNKTAKSGLPGDEATSALCVEADARSASSHLKEKTGNLVTAALCGDNSVAKACVDMDGRVKDQQSLTCVKKHNKCVMRSSNLTCKLKDANGERCKRKLRETRGQVRNCCNCQSGWDGTSGTRRHPLRWLAKERNAVPVRCDGLGTNVEICTTFPRRVGRRKTVPFRDSSLKCCHYQSARTLAARRVDHKCHDVDCRISNKSRDLFSSREGGVRF